MKLLGGRCGAFIGIKGNRVLRLVAPLLAQDLASRLPLRARQLNGSRWGTQEMDAETTIRKIASVLLIVLIAAWAEAGLALVQSDPVMQCSMSMHEMQAMGEMSCCPLDEASPGMSAERPPCCSVSQAPERPLGFVSSARVKAPSLEIVAVVTASFVAPAANHFAVWRSANAPRFVKPVLELKTDLRI